MRSGPMSFEDVVARATPYSPDVPARWGTTLVVAPHPDDESLGCGGAIALLRQQEQTVQVLFVSDGSMSHPNSQKYSAEARRDLREQEARNALAILGVSTLSHRLPPSPRHPSSYRSDPYRSVPSAKSACAFDEATTPSTNISYASVLKPSSFPGDAIPTATTVLPGNCFGRP